VHEPQILLLDEPTAGLDASAGSRLTRVVQEEAKRGAVVVVVTHDSRFAEAVGGPTVTLERGRRVDGDG
jgi:ABC-type multidrug transport system ATPase subunit